MTTAEIEALANRGRIASADFNLKTMLRRVVVPQFLEDIGDTRWQNMDATLSVTPAARTYDLPADFYTMVEVYAPWTGQPSGSQPNTLEYIGDDPLKVAQAEQGTGTWAQCGGGYYIKRKGTAPNQAWQLFALSATPSSSFTLPYKYRWFIPFKNVTDPTADDNTADVNLTTYIPEPLQAGLISGLRAEILCDRYGSGDKRYADEMNKYGAWVLRAQQHRDLAREKRATFME